MSTVQNTLDLVNFVRILSMYKIVQAVWVREAGDAQGPEEEEEEGSSPACCSPGLRRAVHQSADSLPGMCLLNVCTMTG